MKLRNGKVLDNGKEPYIVAEFNSSHNGKISAAKEMIDAAKECGCDAVKFQSWSAESLYCEDYYKANPISKRMVGRFALKPEDLLELCQYCGKVGIDFSSTPYSKEEVDFLADECRAPFIKVASMDINHLPYLTYIAKKNVPVVLSTGMATLDEITAAVDEIEKAGNHDICILHCVSLYPVQAGLVNLNNLVMLKEAFPNHAVGYSDHTVGCEVSCAAVALGAALIEKHFTLDNKKIGWDNQMATEPGEMKDLVDKCKNVYSSLGSFKRFLTPAEVEQRKKMRRSIAAAADMEPGHIIREEDLAARRPGDGIPVSEYESLIGQTVKRGIQAGRLILKECIQEN